MSANAADENTYTPMHAAASYGHLPVLDLLISRGGLVDVTDDDGETPLFVVESVSVARYLIEHGASHDIQNNDGETATQKLDEEFPEVADYLRSLSGEVRPAGRPPRQPEASLYFNDRTADYLTSDLLAQSQAIIERANAEGRDPEDELQQLVGDTMIAGIRAGQQEEGRPATNGNDSSSKHLKLDD